MTITATDVLNDDMLARFDERAPQYDREKPVLRRGLRRAAAIRLSAGCGATRVRLLTRFSPSSSRGSPRRHRGSTS
jgi:hypothetical protein